MVTLMEATNGTAFTSGRVRSLTGLHPRKFDLNGTRRSHTIGTIRATHDISIIRMAALVCRIGEWNVSARSPFAFPPVGHHPPPPSALLPFYPSNNAELPQCLFPLGRTHWNPPPPIDAIFGDLLTTPPLLRPPASGSSWTRCPWPCGPPGPVLAPPLHPTPSSLTLIFSPLPLPSPNCPPRPTPSDVCCPASVCVPSVGPVPAPSTPEPVPKVPDTAPIPDGDGDDDDDDAPAEAVIRSAHAGDRTRDHPNSLTEHTPATVGHPDIAAGLF